MIDPDREVAMAAIAARADALRETGSRHRGLDAMLGGVDWHPSIRSPRTRQ